MEAAITIDRVFPWGRSLDEYQRMFALSEKDLEKRILSCADGPAAFNATMTRSGRRVISVDPLYAFSAEQIRQRIDATHDLMVQRARDAAHRFVWNQIKSPEHMGARAAHDAPARPRGDRGVDPRNPPLERAQAGREGGRHGVHRDARAGE